jgi:hypothetical protein
MANSLLDKIIDNCPAQRGEICPAWVLNDNPTLAKYAAKGSYVSSIEFEEITALLERIRTRLKGGELSTKLLENI